MIARALLVATLLIVPAVAGAAQGDKKEPDPNATPVPNRPAAVEGGSLYSIQPRKYQPGHEFKLATGFLPQDAYYKGTTIDFSYTYHFSDVFAVEALRGIYSWNHKTDLVRRLEEEFQVENDPFEKVQYLISSHVIVTPFYGKQTLFNRAVVHQELYFIGGVGGVGWVLQENGRSDRPTEFRPAIDIGAGFRWYVSKMVSVRFEAYENLFQTKDGGIDDQVYVSFGLSLSTRR